MDIKNSLESSQENSNALKSKCVEIGQSNIYKAELTNVDPVKESVSRFDAAAKVLQAYKQQLDEDAAHLEELGFTFDEIDHEIASFLK